jgi:hypothetical protein
VACGQQRRLVAPPGPDATTCADCAGLPVTHACTDCGIEDKMFEKGRCDRCSLRRRVTELLSAGTGHVPPQLTGRIIVRIEQIRLADGTTQAIRGAGVAARTDAKAAAAEGKRRDAR